MNFKFMMYFYLQYVHQHVSAGNTVILSMAIQEFNCSSLCHRHSIILNICSETPTDNTSPILWVGTRNITAIYITPQTLNNCNFHYFIISHFYPVLFYIIIQK